MLRQLREFALNFVITLAGGVVVAALAAFALHDTGPAGQWYDRDATWAFLVGFPFHLSVISGLSLSSSLAARIGGSRQGPWLAGSGLAGLATVTAALALSVYAAGLVAPSCTRFDEEPTSIGLVAVMLAVGAVLLAGRLISSQVQPSWAKAIGGIVLVIVGGAISSAWLDSVIEHQFWHCE